MMFGCPGGDVHLPQQFWGDGLLVMGWQVKVVEDPEEAFDGWVQEGAIWDVNGVWLVMVPKRRSQTTCSIAQRANNHQALTPLGKSTIFIPFPVWVVIISIVPSLYCDSL
jgi:hypothetical protein